MKKNWLFILLAFPLGLLAQDTIYLKDKQIVVGCVEQILAAKVKYHLSSNPNGPIYNLDIINVEYIVFENGWVTYFIERKGSDTGSSNNYGHDSFLRKSISLNPLNIFNGNVNFAFSLLSNSRRFIFRIPIKIGFKNKVNGYFPQSSITGRKLKFSGGLDVLIYPGGWKKVSYVMGVGVDFGRMNYFETDDFLGLFNLPSSNTKYITGSYATLYMYNGIFMMPTDGFRLSFLGGVGPRIHDSIQESGYAISLSLNFGYAF